jgi:hypothetical protein
MKKTFFLLSLLAVLLTTQSSQGQVQQVQQVPTTIPGYTEGPISSITLQPDGSVVMTVIGVTVKVPVGTPVESPTRSLTLRQLALRTRLPGRTEPGFIGGTALIHGIVEVATGSFTATDMVVEPAENVLIGVVTQASPLLVMNSEIAPIADARIPFSMVNQFGFNITAPTIPVGTTAAANGYFADGKFQTFLMELTGNFPLTNTNSQINIMRAQSRERAPNDARGDEVDMRGFYHARDGSAPIIQIFRVDGTVATLLGNATIIPDVDLPKFGVWNFRIDTPLTANPVLGSLPVRLRAVLVAGDRSRAVATIDPDLRP